jgi:hypothetical protein
MLESSQLVYGRQNLSNLICLGLPFFVLDVDPRVSQPWGFENRMARAALARFTEIVNAQPK